MTRLQLTPEQIEHRIAAMMTGRRLALRNPGPRHFPEYTGQSTREYVRAYEYKNRTGRAIARPFTLDDLYAPVGNVVRKQGV